LTRKPRLQALVRIEAWIVMTTSAIDVLGGQLRDFLTKQFAPPPGASTVLGFLGTGILVDASSFINQGIFNPARISQWLDIVADPLGAVAENGNVVGYVPWTATQFVQAIYTQALSSDPLDSPGQAGFNKTKATAVEGLGGSTGITTAPLDWYDPARIPQWPQCSLNASTSNQDGDTKMSGQGLPGERPAYWAWRNIPSIKSPVESSPAPTVPKSEMAIAKQPRLVIQPAEFASPAPAPQIHAAAVVSRRAAVGAGSFRSEWPSTPLVFEQPISVERVPNQIVLGQSLSPNAVLRVSQQMSTATNQSTSSSVGSKSITLNLKYQVVSLSRAPWWSEFFLALINWYVPGCKRGALINTGPDGKNCPGVPVALVLTSDVNIRATWSESDRQAAAGSTHLGPWSLSSSQFSAVSTQGEEVLTIPGVTAIACIYSRLPILPPQSDPSLAPDPPPPGS
jgi:hypothetical protein